MTDGDEDDNGQRQTALIVRPQGAGQNLFERLSLEFYKLTWRTPLHSGRLTGKVPMRLLAVPNDPLKGDAGRGQALRMGKFHYQGFEQAFDGLDYDKLALQPSLTDYIHRFDWLRDLSAA
ncbi:MAG: hypothetical protein RLZZ191_1791 [Pseudomonadota bacterium]